MEAAGAQLAPPDDAIGVVGALLLTPEPLAKGSLRRCMSGALLLPSACVRPRRTSPPRYSDSLGRRPGRAMVVLGGAWNIWRDITTPGCGAVPAGSGATLPACVRVLPCWSSLMESSRWELEYTVSTSGTLGVTAVASESVRAAVAVVMSVPLPCSSSL